MRVISYKQLRQISEKDQAVVEVGFNIEDLLDYTYLEKTIERKPEDVKEREESVVNLRQLVARTKHTQVELVEKDAVITQGTKKGQVGKILANGDVHFTYVIDNTYFPENGDSIDEFLRLVKPNIPTANGITQAKKMVDI